MTKNDDAQAQGFTGRFAKGRSGNPNGRPKGKVTTRVGSAMDIIVARTLVIKKDGKPQVVSVEEALQHQTYRKAIEGDKTSRRAVMKMIQKRDAYYQKRGKSTDRQIVTLVTEPTDPENASEAMLLLGIASIDERALGMNGQKPPLQLEPWAVQAAISRRRGGVTLTKGEITEIERCTRDGSAIKWPRGTDQ
jgi:hypothetical protein